MPPSPDRTDPPTSDGSLAETHALQVASTAVRAAAGLPDDLTSADWFTRARDLILDPATPALVLVAIANAPRTGQVLQEFLCQREELPEKYLRAYAAIVTGDVRLKLAVLAHPGFLPGDLVRQLAQHVDTRLRVAAARRADAPADVLATLAWDESLEVREAIVANLNAPPDALRVLVRDTAHAYIREFALMHPNCPFDAVEVCANDPAPVVRRLARALRLDAPASDVSPLVPAPVLARILRSHRASTGWTAADYAPFLEHTELDVRMAALGAMSCAAPSEAELSPPDQPVSRPPTARPPR